MRIPDVAAASGLSDSEHVAPGTEQSKRRFSAYLSDGSLFASKFSGQFLINGPPVGNSHNPNHAMFFVDRIHDPEPAHLVFPVAFQLTAKRLPTFWFPRYFIEGCSDGTFQIRIE